ncbi:hypothetical protein REPUB_Repub05bG0036400 [Reevesia pubescens]
MEDLDRISDLPDVILSRILSFLSTKEAVGTSILSTRWRYLFALVSNLDFELNDELLERRNKRKSTTIKSFVSFVNRVLFFHNTGMENFRLKCGQAVDSSHVYGWISAALWRGVQHLDLNISIGKFKFRETLPVVLFNCSTLVTLKLDFSSVLDVPNSVCFPNLKMLHLKSIEFINDDSVKSLFSSCISLEEMVIEGCNMKNISKFTISHPLLKRSTILDLYNSDSIYWIVIDTPTLENFKYNDYVAAGYLLNNLQSLVSADIDIIVEDGTIGDSHHQADETTAFFRGIRSVQSLNLSSSSVKEVLSYLPEVVPSCLSFNLKAIEISEFNAEKDCIEKAKYILKNARVLEKLTIRTTRSYPSISEKQKLKISQELLGSPRKSKRCCILIV